MENLQLFKQAVTLLERGQYLALVTVIHTTGSTPGKVGYKMLVWGAEPQTMGTVGGGVVEAEVIAQAGALLSRPQSKILQYQLGETANDEKGICGGSVEMLVETFDTGALAMFRDLVQTVEARESAALVSLMSLMSPDAPLGKLLVRDGEPIEAELSADVRSALHDVLAESRDSVFVSSGENRVFIESLIPAPTLILLGAGHVSFYVARFAKGVGFRVTVCDDRPEYACAERFPEADGIEVVDFNCLRETVHIDRHSCVVIVTRGHRHDEIVLEQVLNTEARYIGMIGSKRKTQIIRERLQQRSASAEMLDRVYAPIGLSIGAVTAEEIALSIVGELVKIRRLGRGPDIAHMSLGGIGGQP